MVVTPGAQNRSGLGSFWVQDKKWPFYSSMLFNLTVFFLHRKKKNQKTKKPFFPNQSPHSQDANSDCHFGRPTCPMPPNTHLHHTCLCWQASSIKKQSLMILSGPGEEHCSDPSSYLQSPAVKTHQPRHPQLSSLYVLTSLTTLFSSVLGTEMQS